MVAAAPHNLLRGAWGRSKHMATPCPPPMHSVAKPRCLPVRFISWRRSTATRQPEAPKGWPMEMAPPLTLTFEVSQPMTLFTDMACAAKASLASMRSRSLAFHFASSSALVLAGMGPVPMIFGSTPAMAKDRTVAMTSRPLARAISRGISKQSAAPSLSPEALPAVTVPPFGLKAGRNFANPSAEASVLMNSSCSKTLPLGSFTGTIWSLNFPAFCAAAAFCWEPSANASCEARSKPYFSAMFSAVIPMW
mmetsp:Transcript_96309/g.269514  ORF Transcript_96309/g.269514 Transcript_96309/m.269514 type:complete len:250 (-) Transcript_96309:549-1298(-)